MTKLTQKRKRRGVVLSPLGLQRLQEAQEQAAITANRGYAYTLEQLSELTGLSVRSITRLQSCKIAVDRQTLEEFFRAFNLNLTEQDYLQPEGISFDQPLPVNLIAQDWGEAPDVSTFYGRSAELATLTNWILQDNCRLIGIIGIGGVGKTALSVKLAEQIQDQFTYVIWRSLRNAPPLEMLLADLVPFLSQQQDTQTKPKRLLHWLRTHRCLVILDNVETIMQAGDRAGYYQPDYENYGELFRLLGEAMHQSCVLLTSREKPAEIGMMESQDAWVRSWVLGGSLEAVLSILDSKLLIGTDAEKRQLCEFYSCSPLALKVVASSIQSLFDGDISDFLREETLVFNGIRRLLDQQFERLSHLEKSIMYWLAINREWTSIAELSTDIVPTVARASLLESLESLTWRNLIEKRSSRYTQQPVVMEYVTEHLIHQIVMELVTQKLSLFGRYALVKTTVSEYI
ncbi:hypothetical protein C7B61_17770, partial [filamentous cyanobacterium CCP1]